MEMGTALFHFYSQRFMQQRRYDEWFSMGQNKIKLQILSFNNKGGRGGGGKRPKSIIYRYFKGKGRKDSEKKKS